MRDRRTLGWWCLWLGCAVASGQQLTQAGAVKFKTLADLPISGGGYYPQAGLAQGLDGNLYGTTLMGGPTDCGTVFQLTPSGTLTTLYNFCTTADDGSNPSEGALTADIYGNLYGTTTYGGTSSASGPCLSRGCGTIFKITTGGTLTTLYNFCSQENCADGTVDYGGLARGDDGNFYGTTAGGGTSTQCSPNNVTITGCGAVFKITPAGAFTTVYSFCVQAGCPDGSDPATGLVAGADGSLYGMTSSGGANGAGTIFKITLGGSLTILYSFGGTDGSCGTFGCAPMIQARNGNFYGTANVSGLHACGTIFQMTPAGALTSLYTFSGNDGCSPFGMVQGSDGNFYGSTVTGGPNACMYGSCGTLFEISPAGTLTTIYSFKGDDGYEPENLAQATNGKLYGSTYFGGTSNNGGTLFGVTAGLSPFVEMLPTSGRPDQEVAILGTNLGNATRVRFNGVAAVYTVKSNSLITARVPTGSTTGIVTVTVPQGMLRSSVNFRVRP